MLSLQEEGSLVSTDFDTVSHPHPQREYRRQNVEKSDGDEEKMTEVSPSQNSVLIDKRTTWNSFVDCLNAHRIPFDSTKPAEIVP